MREIPNSKARLNLIVTLWGLLLTKCFLLEFLVRHYEVPVNSLTYVWALSLLMASVATAVYADWPNKAHTDLRKQPGFAWNTLSGLAVSLLALTSLLAPTEGGGKILASATLVLALKHAWFVLRGGGATSRWLALGWFTAGVAIASLGNPAGFLIFALSLICLTVMPACARFLVLRRTPDSQHI